MKNYIIFTVKIIITILTIYWVYDRYQYNFEQVADIVTNPKFFFFFFSLTFLKLLITTFRYHLLLPIEFSLQSFKKVLMTSWASTFISNIAPSGIFGDIYKIKKVSDDNTELSKDQTLHASILVKSYTLFSYVITAFIASLFLNTSHIEYIVITRIYLGIFCVLIMLVPFFIELALKYSLTNYPSAQELESNTFHSNFFKRRFQHLMQFYLIMKGNHFYFFRMTISSILIQFITVFIFQHILNNIAPEFSFSLIEAAFHFTYSYFISTLPISVGGLGVGHIAFAETLSSVGYKQGADIFTIFYILSSIFNIVGGIPFIYGLFRKNQ